MLRSRICESQEPGSGAGSGPGSGPGKTRGSRVFGDVHQVGAITKDLADQLQRAALSIVLNIAEGAGKFPSPDKAVFYTRARASSTESAAVLDVCRKLNLIATSATADNKALLERIAQMLTKLIKL